MHLLHMMRIATTVIVFVVFECCKIHCCKASRDLDCTGSITFPECFDSCSDDLYYPDHINHTCLPCHTCEPGYGLKGKCSAPCEPCGDGFFSRQSVCHRCNLCFDTVGDVTCSGDKDTVCGGQCKPGFFHRSDTTTLCSNCKEESHPEWYSECVSTTAIPPPLLSATTTMQKSTRLDNPINQRDLPTVAHKEEAFPVHIITYSVLGLVVMFGVFCLIFFCWCVKMKESNSSPQSGVHESCSVGTDSFLMVNIQQETIIPYALAVEGYQDQPHNSHAQDAKQHSEASLLDGVGQERSDAIVRPDSSIPDSSHKGNHSYGSRLSAPCMKDEKLCLIHLAMLKGETKSTDLPGRKCKSGDECIMQYCPSPIRQSSANTTVNESDLATSNPDAWGAHMNIHEGSSHFKNIAKPHQTVELPQSIIPGKTNSPSSSNLPCTCPSVRGVDQSPASGGIYANPSAIHVEEPSVTSDRRWDPLFTACDTDSDLSSCQHRLLSSNDFQPVLPSHPHSGSTCLFHTTQLPEFRHDHRYPFPPNHGIHHCCCHPVYISNISQQTNHFGANTTEFTVGKHEGFDPCQCRRTDGSRSSSVIDYDLADYEVVTNPNYDPT